MEKELYIKELRPGVYLMDEAHESTGYLVVGKEKACVIDTMNGYNNLCEAVRRITEKPVFVINTHGHPDHVLGNVYFKQAYIHPADLPMAQMFLEGSDFVGNCRKNGYNVPSFTEIREGDVFDLGEKHLVVYELPGHTAGGILLLLKEDRILFTGDGINHHLWMQLDHSLPMEELVKNLDRVMFLESEADYILHGHSGGFDDISLMRCLRNGAEEICKGKNDEDSDYQFFGGLAKQHPFECLADKQYQQNHHVICYDEKKLNR
ncbi:MAG: MBL fold metallo-hydrolase [Oscillospiraceae bacterium]|nr:MBL fold metallo-hydrolase [Oscillospiraceae bacterium]